MSFYLRAILCVVITVTVISDIKINALEESPKGFCAKDSLNDACNTLDVKTASLFGILDVLLSRVSRNVADVRFLLYPVASKPDFFQEIVAFDPISLNASSFDGSKPVKILIHGFLSNYASQYPQNVKNAYLKTNKNDKYSVIIVDWGKLAKPESLVAPAYYPEVTQSVEPTGVHVGEVITWLSNATGLDLRNVHLVGHSLGAHVAGWAGATVYKKTGKKVGRITALDPAGPFFKTDTLTKRLEKGDAYFVDSYHTDVLEYGTHLDVGHVHFYLNGGTTQPGCISHVCNHNRCHQLFSQMILEGPPSRPSCACYDGLKYAFIRTGCCNKEVFFGEYCPEESSGTFYLTYDFNCHLYEQVSDTCLWI